MPANIARIYLVGLWVEAVFWGMNCILVGAAVHILVSAKRKLHWILLPSCLIMYALATIQVILSLCQLIEGFTGHPAIDSLGGSQAYFGTQNELRNAQYFIYATSLMLQDILLIWRLYVVWGQNWKIIAFPVFLEIVGTACSFTAVVFLTQPGGQIFSPKVHRWGLASWSINVIVNIGVPIAIAWRLVWVARRIGTVTPISSGNRYLPALRTIVESGLIYAAAITSMYALSLANNPINAIGINGLTQLATLVPLLIIARAGQARASKAETSTHSSSRFASRMGRAEVQVTKFQEARSDAEFPMDDYPETNFKRTSHMHPLAEA